MTANKSCTATQKICFLGRVLPSKCSASAWPRVGPGQYFVLGDNRTRSCDSRAWGTVPRANLIGPVMLTYWPPNRGSLR